MAPPTADAVSNRKIFDQLSFVVVRSATLSDEEATEIANRIRIHGGEAVVDAYPADNLDLNSITHIVSSTSDFPDYNAATDALLPVVKREWLDDAVLKQRLPQTRQYSPDPRYFMSDVVICCADIPEGDADAIAGGILAMGGNFVTKPTALTTHIVALSMDNDICETASTRQWRGKYVLPHWFDDCLKLGRKIDEKPYELPNPEILQEAPTKPPGGRLTNKSVKDANDPHPDQKLPHKGLRAPNVIFKGKIFKFSEDLGIGPYLREILDGTVQASHGSVTENIHEADYYVCRYRDGSDYQIASRKGIFVGNLAWMYYLITHDRWTSPFRRLLHYPVARQGLPGFKGLKISLSNYSGESRTYLEQLILATGAECTKTLRQENTHLITAHDQSEKCTAAKEWGVHLVNHLWLEESYAKWKMQSVSLQRYTHFPRRTNLGEVVGQTGIDRDTIERHFLEAGVDVSDAIAVTKDAKSVKPKFTVSVPQKTPKAETRHLKNGNGNSNVPDGQDGLQTPVPSRITAIGKENVTPRTTESRKSKDAAAAKLHSMTSDIELYEKEKKRRGGVVYGGRRKATGKVKEEDDEDEDKSGRKRSFDQADGDSDDEVDSKKQKKGPASISMHLLISGYKRWIGKPKDEDAELIQLRSLGIIVVTDPAKATHLAVPHIVRTPKFVTALAYAPVIISTDFIDACLDQNELLSPEQYKLKDAKNEKKLGMVLEKSCRRAKENNHQLLAGRSIFVVEKIHGGFETYQDIVTANGGECFTFRGRQGTVIPSKRAGSDASMEDDPSSEVYLLSSDSKDDQRVWPRFVKMAEGSRKVARIVKSEWLLDTAMCQEIQATTAYEMHPKL